jgi:hypothetical protein
MDNLIDIKIKSLLEDLEKASERSRKFIGQELKEGVPMKIMDIYDMGLAYDEEQRLLMEFEKALSERYPDKYPREVVDLIEKQIQRLTRNVRAWQSRQMPSEFRG